MKIINVTPGLIPIPPNGWGAVEKIIWETHNNLQKLGHQSEIKYLNDIDKDSADIIHIHVANLALEAHERGIPYYFTMHDHHSYLFGKDSENYKNNHAAIKHSILSFLPAPYLVEYFGLDNAVYLPHGVNTETFTPSVDKLTNSILCVANNGYAHNPTYDRKGFLPAIESAVKLDMPITICGPKKNNELFFEKNKHLLEYGKLNIKYDLTEDQLVEEYKRHTIFLHLSELEAGHPNLTILEAMASGLVVVGTLDSNVNMDGIVKVNDLKDAVRDLEYAIDNWEELQMRSLNSVKEYDWYNITKRYILNYKYSREAIRNKFATSYESATISYKPIKELDNIIDINFTDGCKVEILGSAPKEYLVNFIDADTDDVVYSTSIKNNHWCKVNQKYYTNWKVEVISDGNIIDSHIFNPTDKHIFIKFESSALGDTLAWVPYVEEFRKKHNCKVSCFTFMNDLFKKSYPEINWVNGSINTDQFYATYSLGWFYTDGGTYDKFRNPTDFKAIPLQKTASDILGLDYTEIRPKLEIPKGNKSNKKLALIAIQSTMQAKYWNNIGGWDALIKYLKEEGFEVACIDKYDTFGVQGQFNQMPSGILDWTGNVPLQTRIEQLASADLFIGIGSGLSWLSWAVGCPTVLISGFSYDWTEMQDCIRVTAPTGACTGCFNKVRLDASDWNWCPYHKGSNRQFECTKLITSEMVIDTIKSL